MANVSPSVAVVGGQMIGEARGFMYGVCKAQWLRSTSRHCLCPAALLSDFIPVALTFGESPCSLTDPLMVEHPLLVLSLDEGILILIGVILC